MTRLPAIEKAATANPYRGPRARPPRRTEPLRSKLWFWWSVLLAPYLAYAAVLLAAMASARLGVQYSEQTRETIINAGAGLSAGSVRALFLWPTAFLLERVLRSFSATRTGFRHLALAVFSVGVYVNGTLEILARCGVLSREHPVPATILVVTTASELLAAPLLLIWVVLWLSRRRRY